MLVKRPPLLVSQCLLNQPCRYDARAVADFRTLLIEAGWEIIPTCPEVMGGLTTPRLPSEIQSNGRILNKTGDDITDFFDRGVHQTLALVKKHHIKYALLKSKSPSCGRDFRYDGTFSGQLIPGDGHLVRALKPLGLTLWTEHELALCLSVPASLNKNVP